MRKKMDMALAKNSNNFIERSIFGALSFLKESVFSDEYASKKGFLQAIDPRVKLCSILSFIVLVLLVKNIFVISSIYTFCLLLAVLSGVRIGFFLKRTWVFIPLFSLFIAIPALFSFFSPGEALAGFKIAGVNFIITRQGLSSAVLFVMRVVTSVSLAVLLSITTRHFELLRVLRIFKIPQMFVMTLGMCYRYIYLFVQIIENTYTAIKSRTGTKIHYRKGQHIVAWNIASLWMRSYQLNEEVYQAMLSRGYKGEPVVSSDFKTKTIDWLWLSSAAIIVILAGYFNK